MALEWKQFSGKWNLQTQGQAAGAYTWPGATAPWGIWTWGDGSGGQLGLGNVTDYSSPVQVGALTGWDTICMANTWAIATKLDGTLWTWGSGNLGQLGHGNTTNISSPVQVGALTTWKSVPLNSNINNRCAAAITTSGTLYTWGDGSNGGLGHGNTTGLSSPVQVGALTDC